MRPTTVLTFIMPTLILAFRPSGSSLFALRAKSAHRVVVHAASFSTRHFMSFNAAEKDVLAQIAANATRVISFDAYVTRRRPMGSALTFLDLASMDPAAREIQVTDARATLSAWARLLWAWANHACIVSS